MNSLIVEASPKCRFCNKEEQVLFYVMRSESMIKTTMFTMCAICRKELIRILTAA